MSCIDATQDLAAPPVTAGAAPRSPWRRLVDEVRAWDARVRLRRELARLDDHVLADIGLTRADVEAEAAKPFWRA